MSISSETASLGSGSLKGKDPRNPSVIAEFNKRRLRGDYGAQPNAPSVGIRMTNGPNTSAIKAMSTRVGPELWHPSPSDGAQRASTLASSSSSSFIPNAHYVEDPRAASLASKAATSAIQVTGEEYGAKHQPDAYNWGKKQSQWSHLGASSALAHQQQHQQNTSSGRTSTGIDSLKRAPPTQSIDISKVLSAAQTNAQNRIASAENHLPANFGTQTEEQKQQRRTEVLNLISIADQRVKARLADLDRDAAAPQNVFGSIEFQKIAMEVATRTHSGRLDNHGKLNLGGGLYMTQDEVDDIARRHVQPVIDKVQMIADKKRIADREAAEREALAKQQAAEEKEKQRQRKAEEKQRSAEEKQRRKAAEQAAKQKRERAEARAKEQHPQGSHLWHWQQVEIIKEEVKEAKQQREDKQAEVSRLRAAEEAAKKDLQLLVDRHHELKRDYFGRGEAIEAKQAEYDSDASETVSLFELKQQRETVKENTKVVKAKRLELEEKIQSYGQRASDMETEAEQAQQHHHDLKKKYFEARSEAEEAERKFQIEEEARLKREAEERAKREAEEAERKKREAEEAKKAEEAKAKEAEEDKAKKAEEDKAKKQAAEKENKRKSASSSSAGVSTPAPAAAAAAASSSSSPSSPKEGLKLPPKSQLVDLGDARSGPILSGYKNPTKDAKDSAAIGASASAAAAGGAATGAPVAGSTAPDANKDVHADAKTDLSTAEATKDLKKDTQLEVQTPKDLEQQVASSSSDKDSKTDKDSSAKGAASGTPAAAALGAMTDKDSKAKTESAAAPSAKDSKDSKDSASAGAASGTAAAAALGAMTDKDSKEASSSASSKPRTYEEVIRDEEARARATEKKVSSQGSETSATFDPRKEESPVTTISENTSAKGGAVVDKVTQDLNELKVGASDAKTDLSNKGKDAFSGFDSSNVKEKVEESAGVFKEDL